MNIWSAWIVAIWRLIFVGPAPDAEPEAYCTGAYVQHWFKRGPVCLRCGKPNARHRLPTLYDTIEGRHYTWRPRRRPSDG